MTQFVRALFLAVACVFASGWAAWLVKLHHDAVQHALEPGLLCGPEGGCGDVLASSWSTIAKVPVSMPAIPLFAALAILAIGVAAGKLRAERVASLTFALSSFGLLFGGWLLYHMLADVGELCKYCLVMDGSTLVIAGLALVLPEGGPRQTLAGLAEIPKRLFGPGPEIATLAAISAGTVALAVGWPDPVEPSETPTVVVETAGAAAVPAGKAETTGETRRVVIPAEVVDVPIGAATRLRGNPNAPVTIAVFEDFQCPYCRKLTANLDGLLAERPEQVRIAWFDFPMHRDCNTSDMKKDLHPSACGAAIAGVCAGRQGKFWELHDLMFANNGALEPENLTAYGKTVGLDLAAFDACRQDPSALEAVRADSTVGAKLGVSGTPMFFVNGRLLSGAQPPEALRAIVDAIAKQPNDRVLLDVAMEGEILGDVGAWSEDVTLNGPRGPFRMDRFEASLDHGVAKSVPGVEPARGVSWTDAAAACKAANKRLCAEDEWLAACTGALPVDGDSDGVFSDDPIVGRPHPYAGVWPQDTWCATTRKRDDVPPNPNGPPETPKPLITGNHPKCATPEGVFDLEGNVKEWVGLSADHAGLKGGSYFSQDSARCGYFRDFDSPDLRDRANGFRCCSGPAPEIVVHHPGGKVGDDVVAWSLPTLDGKTMTSADLKGRPYILTFWASWCGPCRAEMPALEALSAKFPDILVIGVNVDKDTPKAQAFLAKTAVSFPIVLDPTSAFMAQFDTRGTPTTFWVTKSGHIRQRTIGYDPTAQTAFEGYAAALVSAP